MTSIVHLLHRAGQLADEAFVNAVGDSNLTPRQLAILQAVSADEGLNQTTVTAVTGIDRSTTADIIRRLVANDLLQRTRSRSDARQKTLKLTDKGRVALRAGSPAAQAADAKLLERLTAEEREVLVATLTKVIEQLGEPDADR
jgi:DNA-binding MarR family transcriptional regulator